MGARFRFEGQEFVKTGPLFATGKEGGQRLIPKYAVLEAIGELPSAAGQRREKLLARAAALGAFEAFCSDCRGLLPAEREAEFEAARERFLCAIEAARPYP